LQVIRGFLTLEQLQKPADPASQPALLAELAIANENIRFFMQERTQALYYLFGLIAASLAFGANAATGAALPALLRAHAGLRFLGLVLGLQLFLWVVALLGVVVYGVVFKANDSIRFHAREIARLHDVLFGLPRDGAQVSPLWVAVNATEHDVRDTDELFSVNSTAESLAIVVVVVAVLCILGVTLVASSVTIGPSTWAVLAIGAAAVITMGVVFIVKVLPMMKAAQEMSVADDRAGDRERRALARERKLQ
jgi:hypothetical protein